MILSRTGAQVGLLTEPLASSLHRCLSKTYQRDSFVFGNQRGIFGIALSEYKQFFKIQLIDLELMLHVVDSKVGRVGDWFSQINLMEGLQVCRVPKVSCSQGNASLWVHWSLWEDVVICIFFRKQPEALSM